MNEHNYFILGTPSLSATSKFVTSTQIWLKTIPTRNCDVLITFPRKTTDETLLWLLMRMKTRAPELIVTVRHHGNTGLYGFYLTASYDRYSAITLCLFWLKSESNRVTYGLRDRRYNKTLYRVYPKIGLKQEEILPHYLHKASTILRVQ